MTAISGNDLNGQFNNPPSIWWTKKLFKLRWGLNYEVIARFIDVRRIALPMFGCFMLLPTTVMSREPISPVPLTVQVNPGKARLGEKLFFDIRLSSDDPFFTTKEVNVGTGLGMSISHRIIESHGGEIQVASEPGAGTCITLTLPLRS